MSLARLNTNEKLGYPADARLLIVNVDDFGMCHSVNEAMVPAIREGLAVSCTLMVPCPWALHGIQILKEHPDIPFGVHLTAISDEIHYRWRPLTCGNEVPSLIDEEGYFYTENRMTEFLRQADLSELENEFRAQIEWVLAYGLKPTHVDSHCCVHTRREDIFDMTARLAREYGVALRVGELPFIKTLQGQGYATDDHELLDSYRLPTHEKPLIYLDLLRALPPGLSEWACHPGIDTAELRAAMSTWEVRSADFEFLMSPEARAVVEEEGIVILSYEPLQELACRHPHGSSSA
jgi:predicted glycoside hydrolase/deacetylase ChbG (UPF0249 family)